MHDEQAMHSLSFLWYMKCILCLVLTKWVSFFKLQHPVKPRFFYHFSSLKHAIHLLTQIFLLYPKPNTLKSYHATSGICKKNQMLQIKKTDPNTVKRQIDLIVICLCSAKLQISCIHIWFCMILASLQVFREIIMY